MPFVFHGIVKVTRHSTVTRGKSEKPWKVMMVGVGVGGMKADTRVPIVTNGAGTCEGVRREAGEDG